MTQKRVLPAATPWGRIGLGRTLIYGTFSRPDSLTLQ